MSADESLSSFGPSPEEDADSNFVKRVPKQEQTLKRKINEQSTIKLRLDDETRNILTITWSTSDIYKLTLMNIPLFDLQQKVFLSNGVRSIPINDCRYTVNPRLQVYL